MFTEVEKVILSKYNVDYRFAPQEDMLENFDDKNLQTIYEQSNKNVLTKSLVLAPYNSSNNKVGGNWEPIKVENNICRFAPQARDADRNYELNNNGEIDVGILINNDNDDKKKKKYASEPLSPKFAFKFKKMTGMNSPVGETIRNRVCSKEIIKSTNTSYVDEHSVSQVEKIGFKKDFIMKCILHNERNYATTAYALINSDK